MERPDPLVTAAWLRDHLSDPDVRVIDASWSPPWMSAEASMAAQYRSGHIPGAVFFDIDDIAAADTNLPHMLPDPVKFSSRVRRLGIGDGNRIVAYDRGGFLASARAWWMLRAMGHDEVVVLDGGFDAWRAAGGQVEDLPPVAVERHCTPRVQADLIADASRVEAARDRSAALILDARPAGRFSGAAPEPRADLPSGHIPGSVNVPSSDLIASDGTLKPAHALQSIFAAAGWTDGQAVIATCGSGVTAPVIALALARLGHWRTAVYDGSWTDWATSAERPIATAANA